MKRNSSEEGYGKWSKGLGATWPAATSLQRPQYKANEREANRGPQRGCPDLQSGMFSQGEFSTLIQRENEQGSAPRILCRKLGQIQFPAKAIVRRIPGIHRLSGDRPKIRNDKGQGIFEGILAEVGARKLWERSERK